MAENDIMNPDAGWHEAGLPDLVGENDIFADLLELEIVLDAPRGGTNTGGEGLVQDAHSVFLIDDIDLGDVIADVEGPHEIDLTALLDQPTEEFPPGLTAAEPGQEEGFSLIPVDADAGDEFPPVEPAILQDSSTNSPADGFLSTPVTIIVDDGSDSFGTAV